MDSFKGALNGLYKPIPYKRFSFNRSFHRSRNKTAQTGEPNVFGQINEVLYETSRKRLYNFLLMFCRFVAPAGNSSNRSLYISESYFIRLPSGSVDLPAQLDKC